MVCHNRPRLADQEHLSQANLSSLDVPPSFKVEMTPDITIPINSNDIYLGAIVMMYQVTDHPLMQPWFDKDWDSPGGTASISIQHNAFGKDPSRLYTQYIIWGLNHILLSMTLRDQFCQTTAVLKWLERQWGLYVSPDRDLKGWLRAL